MKLATVTDLPVKRDPEPAQTEESEWRLPSGAKPVNCESFGEMDRTIKNLASRVEVLERRLSFLADKLLDATP